MKIYISTNKYLYKAIFKKKFCLFYNGWTSRGDILHVPEVVSSSTVHRT